MSDNRFDFTIYDPNDEENRNHRADILDYDNNFKKINLKGAMLSDLSQVTSITISANSWTRVGNYYETTVSNNSIEVEPQIIDVIFDDLTIIKSPINPKPNSQANGSFKLITTIKPTIDLSAKLILTRGIS